MKIYKVSSKLRGALKIIAEDRCSPGMTIGDKTSLNTRSMFGRSSPFANMRESEVARGAGGKTIAFTLSH